MSKKLDRRKKYTRSVLKQSLMTILENKPISSVTVKEICDKADINRSTFYTHYRDSYDLLVKIEEEIIEDLYQYLKQYESSLDEEGEKMTIKLLEYIADNQSMFKVLLNQNAEPGFEKKLNDVAKQFLIHHWIRKHVPDERESKYLSTFVVSGAIHVIKDWIQQDLDHSIPDMARMINQFINDGLSYIK